MYLRNLMSMDTEEMLRAQPMDAVVMIGGCDKTVPAQMMGAASAGLPAIQLITGSMLTGSHRSERVGACTDCRRYWAKFRAGEIDEVENGWDLIMLNHVLEHIERVVHHVRRLEQSAETAVQMHFSVQGSRTNDIMRTLTVLTAIFLPLNLITGFFGMNFDGLPLIHRDTGLWWALGTMVVVAIALVVVFWRKRYLARSGR